MALGDSLFILQSFLLDLKELKWIFDGSLWTVHTFWLYLHFFLFCCIGLLDYVFLFFQMAFIEPVMVVFFLFFDGGRFNPLEESFL